MAAVHQRFDLDRWVREFTLARQRAEVRGMVARWGGEEPGRYEDQAEMESHAKAMDPDGECVVGPRQIATIEQLRAEAGGAAGLGPGVPVDIFVWARGEPANRAVTKIGGVPYRPRSAPWPARSDGGPGAFLCQFCFADSRDVMRKHAGRLPGDVLCVFALRPDGVWDSDEEDPTALHVEWWPLGTKDLIAPGDVPRTQWQATRGGGLEPCYAELHRTHDYPDVPEDHPIRNYENPERLCVLEGGKIGGIAPLIQDDRPCRGDFLCSLGSIQPSGPRWPLLNVERNPDGEHDMQGDFLMFGDVGMLYFGFSARLLRSGRVHWGVQMY